MIEFKETEFIENVSSKKYSVDSDMIVFTSPFFYKKQVSFLFQTYKEYNLQELEYLLRNGL
jgi:hypothetical protein